MAFDGTPDAVIQRWQMKTFLLVGASIGLLAVSSWAASVNTTRSNTFREFPRAALVTASTEVSGAVSRIVYTTPAAGDFILTQVCTGLATGGTLVQAGGAGIAQVGSGLCQTFTPGMALPPDQVVTCTTFDAMASSFCTINGLLRPAPPTPHP